MPARETSRRTVQVIGDGWHAFRQLLKVKRQLEENPSRFDKLKSAPPLSEGLAAQARRLLGANPARRAHVLSGPARCAQRGHIPWPAAVRYLKDEYGHAHEDRTWCSRCVNWNLRPTVLASQP
jgi:hypothetical protein